MMVTYAAMVGAIVIDSTNNVLMVTEDATSAAATITAGTYFLRDSSTTTDSDNFLYALKTAIEAATAEANTYTLTLTTSTDPASASVTVAIARATGTKTFALLFGSGSTTMDPAIIGFAASNTANDANTKTSTLSSAVLWVSPQPTARSDPGYDNDATVNRANGGQVHGFKRGGPFSVRDLGFGFVDPRRAIASSTTSDPDRAWSEFWSLHSDGRRMEYHEAAISSGTTLATLTSSTRIGTYHFDDRSVGEFRPARVSPGLELYSWDVTLLGYEA